PQVIRRTKADVARDLPDKIPVPCRLPMSNEQRALYVGATQRFNAAHGDDEQARMHHLALLRYLRLVCADPRPIDVAAFVPEAPDWYHRKAPKMQWLVETLRAIQSRREKALLFAEDREVQRLLQHYISADFGFAPRMVNGYTSVSAKSNASRQRIASEFQSAPGFGVLILSPLAAGFGLNIQGANHVIHYLRHWNPAKEDQATDRAYRIGQTKDVHVYCPLAVASDFKTFDVKLDELLARKRELAVDMLQGTGAVSSDEFDLSEIAPA
ncbi:MAG TPA: DEAD/DEAH box helicase, partial [Hyphomicrobiaceae bacterium]|nr:DEAD/DEAH box helicase [Hyphomicrobiaceae bacterium]